MIEARLERGHGEKLGVVEDRDGLAIDIDPQLREPFDTAKCPLDRTQTRVSLQLRSP